jgi:hypothetical protein
VFRHFNKRKSTGLAAILVACVAGASAYAFTNSNTVADPGSAGYSTSSVSGYTVTNVHYALDTSDPTKLDSVNFTLDNAVPAGGSLKLQLAVGGTWYSCPLTVTSVVCDLTSGAPDTGVGPTVASVTKLNIVAAS